jgi:hypothetical protein
VKWIALKTKSSTLYPVNLLLKSKKLKKTEMLSAFPTRKLLLVQKQLPPAFENWNSNPSLEKTNADA